MPRKESFPPIAFYDAEILILGSIPGDKSIELREYYGHPQNRFWPLLARLMKSPQPMNYPEKRDFLRDHKIALWDVAHRAERPGSMDSAITDEEPNDIASLIRRLKSLHTIVFNGQKAEQLYNKYFGAFPHLRYQVLPSTSPANARYSIDNLCEKWHIIAR